MEPINSKLLLWLLSFVSNEHESSSSKEREVTFRCVILEIEWVCLGKRIEEETVR